MSLCASLALAACGSRSSLLPGGGAEGGAGGGGGSSTTSNGGTGPGTTGTSTSTTVTTTTTGTGGGMQGPCNTLVVDGPPLSPEYALGNKQFVPSLARTQADGSQAAFVYVEVNNPFTDSLQTAGVPLNDPWGVWPDSLGSSVGYVLTTGLEVGPGQDGNFAVLTTNGFAVGGDPTAMLLFLLPADGSSATLTNLSDSPPGPPMLVTSNGGDFLAGFQRVVAGDLHALSLSRLPLGGSETTANALACSIFAPLSGAAIPLEGGFLAALSNGRPFGSCFDDQFPDGPPTRIQIAKMPDTPSGATLTFEYDEVDQYVSQAHLAPTAGGMGGAWAGWERLPFEGPVARRIQLLQLDSQGFPDNGKIIDVGYGTPGAPFAIAGLGSRVAVATIVDIPDAGRRVFVYLLSDDGAPLAEVGFAADDGFELDQDSRLSLLASPSGDTLLAAWSESWAGDNDNRHVRLARLTCAIR